MVKLVRDCHETPAQEARAQEARQAALRLAPRRRRRRARPAGGRRGQAAPRQRRPPGGLLASTTRSRSTCSTPSPLLDRESPEYALELLTLVESILEDPELVLQKQLDRLKTEKLAELKAAGVEYDERMAELEKLEYPKPHREFIYGIVQRLRRQAPVGRAGEHPARSRVAREMYEEFHSFSEYIQEYELQRAEGLLLRYLTDVYKALVQTVPEPAKDEERRRDRRRTSAPSCGRSTRASSTSGSASRTACPRPRRAPRRAPRARHLGRHPRPAPVHRAGPQRAVPPAPRAGGQALGRSPPRSSPRAPSREEPGPRRRLDASLAPYFAEHGEIRTDPKARSPQNTLVEVREGFWDCKQIVCDPEDHDEWVIECAIDLDRSREAAAPVIRLTRIGT